MPCRVKNPNWTWMSMVSISIMLSKICFNLNETVKIFFIKKTISEVLEDSCKNIKCSSGQECITDPETNEGKCVCIRFVWIFSSAQIRKKNINLESVRRTPTWEEEFVLISMTLGSQTATFSNIDVIVLKVWLVWNQIDNRWYKLSCRQY